MNTSFHDLCKVTENRDWSVISRYRSVILFMNRRNIWEFQGSLKISLLQGRVEKRRVSLDRMWELSLRRRGFMRSGPQNFVTLRLSSTSLTSSACMVMESKGAWVRGTCCGRVLFSSLTTDCETKYLFNILAFCKSVSAYSLFNARVGTLREDLSSFGICFDVFNIVLNLCFYW